MGQEKTEEIYAKIDETLEDAPQRGWTVVDMQKDWKRVFAPDPVLSESTDKTMP